jgi:outer membrane lipoprotein SlyB
MIRRVIITVIVSGLFLSFVGCTRRDAGTYSPHSIGRVGRAGRVDKGVVVNVRLVNVEGTTKTGAILGGIIGSALGYELGKGNSDAIKIISTAGAVVVGGLVGGSTEQLITRTYAYEYIVEMNSGHLRTIVQRDKTALAHGQKVILLRGPDAKIIPDPGV